EDNKDLRENASLVLGLEGYEVRLARDGREALDLIEDGLIPDLIVSDIMMPRMDGYQFFEAVHKQSHLKGVPFIFLTARSSRQDIFTGRMLGADDYLVKPFDPEEFLLAVQNKLKRAADFRAQAAAGLDEARRLLVQLLSHELRTPLTYVTGGFALLAEELEAQKNQQGDDVRISLDLIQSGTHRLNRLAEQMVLYSEILSGFASHQINTISEHLDLDSLVSDVLGVLYPLYRGRDLTFRRVSNEPDPVIVCGVKNLLVNAISEVVRNAITFSPDGTQIEMRVSCTDGYGILTITDQGIGIKPEDQATVWEVMIQSERDRTEQQGAGMGLPICKGIITAHGGDVFLTSTLDQGTEVTLRLPLAAMPDEM
ncbi:MAG: response regulator, partial [Anaerolineae bacterium]|nr:response regulator [Anaerolineae bacterium]